MYKFIAIGITLLAATFSPTSSYAKMHCGSTSKEYHEFITATQEAIAIQAEVREEYPLLNRSTPKSEASELIRKFEKKLNEAIRLIEPYSNSSDSIIHYHANNSIKFLKTEIEQIKQRTKS